MKRVVRFVLWLLLIELALVCWWTWRFEQRALGPPYYLGELSAPAPSQPATWASGRATGPRRVA